MFDISRFFIEFYEFIIVRILEDGKNVVFFIRLFNLGVKIRIVYYFLYMVLYILNYLNGYI